MLQNLRLEFGSQSRSSKAIYRAHKFPPSRWQAATYSKEKWSKLSREPSTARLLWKFHPAAGTLCSLSNREHGLGSDIKGSHVNERSQCRRRRPTSPTDLPVGSSLN